MVPINRVAAAEIMAGDASYEFMTPGSVLVVSGLVGNEAILEEAADWTVRQASSADHATRVKIDNNLRGVDSAAARHVISLQRQLMTAVAAWQPVDFGGMANNVPPGVRYPRHYNGENNIAAATTLSQTSSFRIHASKHGEVQEAIDMEPDITVVMCNGLLTEQGEELVWHSTYNGGGSFRQTVVQHAYRFKLQGAFRSPDK